MYYSNIKSDRYNVKSLKKTPLHEAGTVQYVIAAQGRLRQDTVSSTVTTRKTRRYLYQKTKQYFFFLLIITCFCLQSSGSQPVGGILPTEKILVLTS